MKMIFHTKYRRRLSRLERHDIRRPGQMVQDGETFYAIDEVEVIDLGRLRVTAHIVSRRLCADTLVRGETHPTAFLNF